MNDYSMDVLNHLARNGDTDMVHILGLNALDTGLILIGMKEIKLVKSKGQNENPIVAGFKRVP